MILIITNKKDYTADYLILGLIERSIDFVRFNTEDFPNDANIAVNIDKGKISGYLKIGNKSIDVNSIKSVWYRRPLLSNPSDQIIDPVAREFIITESKATLESVWRMLSCFWVSHPDKIRVAESKLFQLKIASALGLTIPETCVTNVPKVAEGFYEQTGRSTIFKPQRSAKLVRGETVSLIYTNPIEEHHVKHLTNVQFAPVLLQPYVAKQLEIRATVVGKQVFAVALQSQSLPVSQHDWRRADASTIEHSLHQLPADIEAKCMGLVQEFGLAFGAIDLILTPDQEYVFLEINPNGQWAWIQQLCPEVMIRESIIDLLVKGSIEGESKEIL